MDRSTSHQETNDASPSSGSQFTPTELIHISHHVQGKAKVPHQFVLLTMGTNNTDTGESKQRINV